MVRYLTELVVGFEPTWGCPIGLQNRCNRPDYATPAYTLNAAVIPHTKQ